MKYIIYTKDNEVKMRVSNSDKYQSLKDSLDESEILVDNGEYLENEWPVDELTKKAILKTFRKQLKGKGISL